MPGTVIAAGNTPDSVPVRSRHLLLVDDDEMALTLLSEGLTGAGYQVTCAVSGDDALDCAKGAQFDLAIVDMRMHGMTGAELAKRLIANYGCFSLILSGSTDAESIRAAVEDGALGYLVKPLGIEHLLPSIETALARCREISALAKSRESLNTALQQARETSIAMGILIERRGLNRDSAFAHLRDAARRQRRKVSQLAEDVVHAAELMNAITAQSG
jgi:response regulator NasT